MKNDGFTLIEMLIWICVIGIFTIILLAIGRRPFATSIRGISDINDEEIILAAEKYVEDGNGVYYDNNYTCVTSSTLRNKGYLRSSITKNRYVEVKVSKLTGLVEKSYFVNSCNN